MCDGINGAICIENNPVEASTLFEYFFRPSATAPSVTPNGNMFNSFQSGSKHNYCTLESLPGWHLFIMTVRAFFFSPDRRSLLLYRLIARKSASFLSFQRENRSLDGKLHTRMETTGSGVGGGGMGARRGNLVSSSSYLWNFGWGTGPH